MHLPAGRLLATASVCFIVGAGILAGCGGSHSGSTIPSSTTRSPELNGGNGHLGALSTIYVSGQGGVYAYDLTSLTSPPPSPGALISPAPIAINNGYYYQAGGPGGVTASIAGIATNSTGWLVVVQNYRNPQGDGNSCLLAYIPPRTTTSASNATTATCNNTVGGNTPGTALAVTFTGASTGASPAPSPAPFVDDIDVLMHYQPTGDPARLGCNGTTNEQYEVDRYKAGTASPAPIISAHACIPLPSPSPSPGPYARNYIAGGTNGSFFVDSSATGLMEKYSGASQVATGIISSPGPLAVSVNTQQNVGFRVVASVTGTATTIYSFKVSGGTITFTHALGTFNNPVGALAVDNNGTIYVGVNQPGGQTRLKVYGPAKTEATSPDYVLLNPVRRANPAASPEAVITGIAIAQ